MAKIRLYVFISLLMGSTVLSETNLRFNDVVDATIIILSQCLSPHTEETLLLAGEYNEFLRRSLFDLTPVALIAESKRNALQNFAMTRYSYKIYQNYRFIHFLRRVHRFVLSTSSQPMLRAVLQRTKDSPWANADGFYILIDTETDKRGCINARSYLWAAWEYDLLSVLFICIDPNDGIVYYTYNPYSNETPSSWHEVGRLKGRKGHPWIVFKRKFTEDEELCKDLNFKKTTTLNRYLIRLNAVEMQPFLKINLTEEGLNKFLGENSEIVKILFFKLNASLNIYIHNGTIYNLGGIETNGLRGMLTAIGDGKIDMSMNTTPLFVLWKLRYTYPHSRSVLCVMTRANEQISQFTKLTTFLPMPMKIGLFIICLFTYAIFTRKEGCARAALQVLRLLVCVAILHPPKVNSTRIFICMVFILFLNVNTLFQSHWASLLTLPVYYDNIQSFDHLKAIGYNIYGPTALKELFYDSVLQSRYYAAGYEECKQHVKNSTDSVCAGDCYHMYYRIKEEEEELYMSKALRDTTQTFVTREDWPLYGRVNRAIQQMVQSGLIGKFRKDSLATLINQWEIRQAKRKGFKVMLLPQLAFSFCILGVGYSCASVIFVLELMVDRTGRRRNRNANRQSERARRQTGTADGRGKVATVPAWN